MIAKHPYTGIIVFYSNSFPEEVIPNDTWRMNGTWKLERMYSFIIAYVVLGVGTRGGKNREKRNKQKLNENKLRSLDFVLK